MRWLSRDETPAAGSSSRSTRGRCASERDLDQALAAVGQLADRLERVLDQPVRREMLERLLDHRRLGARGPKEVVAGAGALADRQAEVVEHAQAAEELIDLERAREAPPRARLLGEVRDVLAAQQHAARRRLEHARDQIDEARLAGAVGSDQPAARPARKREADVARDGKRAEAHADPARLERGRAHGEALRLRSRPRSSSSPRSPLGAKSTVSTSRSPMPNCQNSGLSLARLSSSSM